MVTGVLLWWFIQQQHPQLWCLPSFVQPTPPGPWDQNDGASTEAGYCSCFESSSMAFRAKHEMFLFKWFYLSFSLGFGQHWTQHFLFLYCFHCPGCFKPQSRSRDCCRGRWTRVVKTRADLYTSCPLSPYVCPVHCPLALSLLMKLLLGQWRSSPFSAMVVKVWFPGQQPQHHPGTC